MKLLYVVHRYSPFPGGSEIYVQNMAEESQRRGHHVTVFAGEHQGNYNGITVTSDTNILLANWDMIVVHGAGPALQNFVLSNATQIPSPILYMLILPTNADTGIQAMKDCDIIGCSTNADWAHCAKYGMSKKAIQLRHGIVPSSSIGTTGFKQQHNITGRMFLSCGGYWPNKSMRELADLFEIAALEHATLVTTGYEDRFDLMPTARNNVIPLMITDRTQVLSAIYDADCVLMHSYEEGFGLVLLESMINQTPWIARCIAGAETMQRYGQTYRSDAELLMLLRKFDRSSFDIKAAYEHVCDQHLISHTVDDIEVAVRCM